MTKESRKQMDDAMQAIDFLNAKYRAMGKLTDEQSMTFVVDEMALYAKLRSISGLNLYERIKCDICIKALGKHKDELLKRIAESLKAKNARDNLDGSSENI